MQISLTLLN